MMKKVTCTDNQFAKQRLTLDKEYTVIKVFSVSYLIKDDKGNEDLYSKLRFAN